MTKEQYLAELKVAYYRLSQEISELEGKKGMVEGYIGIVNSNIQHISSAEQYINIAKNTDFENAYQSYGAMYGGNNYKLVQYKDDVKNYSGNGFKSPYGEIENLKTHANNDLAKLNEELGKIESKLYEKNLALGYIESQLGGRI